MAVKTIGAGELKRTVSFKKPTSSRNSQGSKQSVFTGQFTARAKIEGTNMRVQEIAPALLNTDTVYIRYSEDRTAIKTDWLLAYDGMDHIIHSVEFIGAERNQFIKLIVKAKDA